MDSVLKYLFGTLHEKLKTHSHDTVKLQEFNDGIRLINDGMQKIQ